MTDAVGNGDAERAAARLAGERIEAQPAMAQVDDHRHVEPMPRRRAAASERGRVGLAVEGKVERDPRAGFEQRPGAVTDWRPDWSAWRAPPDSKSADWREDLYVVSLS